MELTDLGDWTREGRDEDNTGASGLGDWVCGRGLQEEEGENLEGVRLFLFVLLCFGFVF